MSSNSAEYQRAYRARKKAEHAAYDLMKPTIGAIRTDASKRIRELEEEVRHLKEELAKRGGVTVWPPEVKSLDAAFNSRPFTPVPKRATRG